MTRKSVPSAANVMEHADVGMIEGGDRLGFPIETLAELGSAANAEGRTLMATVRSSRVSRARYTSPMPPAPSRATTSYAPRRAPGASDTCEKCADYTSEAKKRLDSFLEQGESESRVPCTRAL